MHFSHRDVRLQDLTLYDKQSSSGPTDQDGNDLEHLPHSLTMILHLTKALTENKSKAATQKPQKQDKKPAVSELR
ncbi:hypothetical protein E2C01_067717 [Portunus trituberculatus]|uniref:Uncharacterized protein n=1 Tax=Portunus trituberculatus TaxID=210409 RepID=A0A5B7HLS8_PORTR|nr:hypothetical protein [Portunus trituberculatus]